jgi:GntR family transcriptional regulator/MocR family aminotransferase
MSKQSLELSLAGIKLSKKSEIPLYTQVYSVFRELILNKRLRPGDRLPATRNLALELGVSRVIITQGFEQLILEGYLVGKTGSGTFVADVIPESLTLAQKDNKSGLRSTYKDIVNGKPNILSDVLKRSSVKEDVVPFLTGTPSLDQFPYKIWSQVAIQTIKNFKHYHLGYDDALGFMPLRQEIAQYLRMARAVNCEPEQVIVINGSQQGLNLVVQCLLNRGDEVWMEDPGYYGAKFAFTNVGANIRPIPIQEDGIDLDYAMSEYDQAKLLYITPSHQFPLGKTLSLAKRLQLLEWAHQRDMWILEDDYDSELRYEGRPLASLQGLDKHQKVIYMGTFTKVLFPGLRLAYVVAPSLEIVDRMKLIKAMLDRQSPILEQAIVASFMQEGHFLRHLRKMRLLYDERKSILIQLLQEKLGDHLEIDNTPAGMNLVAWFTSNIDLEKFSQQTQEQQLVVPLINDYTMKYYTRPGISLGFSAFTKYKMKMGVEKLGTCVRNALV